MDKLTSTKAYELLISDIINCEEDFKKTENKWIMHCIYVGIAAGRIAEKMGIDSDYAKALGFVHDIGRKISHYNHPLEGYHYMINKGYPNEARICLTHSFIDNDINVTAGGGPQNPNAYDEIDTYLKETPPNIYDNIVQLCDLFCLETGFTTIEKRMLDITKRKGVYFNSLNHFNKVLELKKRLEYKMKCNLYTLFPEINQETLNNADKDRGDLLELLNKPPKINIKR